MRCKKKNYLQLGIKRYASRGGKLWSYTVLKIGSSGLSGKGPSPTRSCSGLETGVVSALELLNNLEKFILFN